MEQEEGRHLSIRLESLTEMVFGLALSIGALLLAISSIGSAAQLESNIITFGFSFLILIFVWMRYTTVIADFPQNVRQRRSTTYLSIAMLFLVVIEPYLFNILHTPISASLLGFTSSMYALDVGLIISIIAILIDILIRSDVKSNKRLTVPRRYIYMRGGSISIAVIMLLSALPIFWQIGVFGIPARFFMWLVILPFMAFTRFIKDRRREGGR